MKRIGLPLILATLTVSAQAAEPGAVWFVATAENGAQVGFSSQVDSPVDGGRQVVTRADYYVVAEGGQPTRLSTRSVRTEDGDGRSTLVVKTTTTGPTTTRTTAQITPGKAVVTREARGDRRAVTVALPDDVRFDGGEGLLIGWDPASRPQLAFSELDLDGMAIERVTIDPVASATAGEGRLDALVRRYDGDSLVGVSRMRIDRTDGIVSVIQPLFGTTLTVSRTDQATAERRFPAYPLLGAFLTKSPYRLPDSALDGHIRYIFTFKDGLDFPLMQTGEQRPVAADGRVTVDICGSCGQGLPADPQTLARALEPTPWMQSDHPRLKALARPVAAMAISDTEKMEVLTRRARAQLTTLDYTGHFSALETLSRHTGDCTEAAVLLGAMGRAAGIPTQVVSGLVYSRQSYHGVANTFMPHSWVLAYVDGAWKSFDAALGNFDSTHIALSSGGGDPRSIGAAGQLASLLVWESMAEVRTRPAS